MLDKGNFSNPQTEVIVRVNSLPSGLLQQDLDVILQTSQLPSTLMLPKVETPEDLHWVRKNVCSKEYIYDFEYYGDALTSSTSDKLSLNSPWIPITYHYLYLVSNPGILVTSLNNCCFLWCVLTYCKKWFL